MLQLIVKKIEFLSDTIVYTIDPIPYERALFVVTKDIKNKDISPDKHVLTKGDTELPFHCKTRLPEFYKNKIDDKRAFQQSHYDKKIYTVGEVIGQAIKV